MASPAKRKTAQPGAAADSIRINLSGTKYTVVRLVAEDLGMAPVEDSSNNCSVYWIDNAVPIERFLELKPYQRVNHFPGMGEICRKDSLARNLQRMCKHHSREYSFAPVSWVLPGEYSTLCHHMREQRRRRRHRTFIAKPHNGAMGVGIRLIRSPESVPENESVVVQEYLEKPFLLDGFKCDLRIYVLVTSCNPLRIFVYKDGLVRLSTQQYTPPTDRNLDEHFIHLTNYSVNKHSDSFDDDESTDRGSKRTLKYFTGWLQENGYNATELWARIHDVIIKTVILAHPCLVHSYQACRPGRAPEDRSQFFEILGFDVILDHTLKPWLLEVNRSPSFGTDAQLDLDIKTGVIRDALRLVDIRPSDLRNGISAQKEASRRRLMTHTSTVARALRSPYDFRAEQEEAVYMREKKKQEVKERLLQIRREKELEEHEEANKGDYVRIYPTFDPGKARLYQTFLQDSARLGLVGKSSSGSSHSRGSPPASSSNSVRRLKEHELLDLLSQYEGEQGVANSWYSSHSHSLRPSTSSFQPLALQHSSPMEAVYVAMAAREREEEWCQRTMIDLNQTSPTHPGKSSEEVAKVIQEINADMKLHKQNIASFWLAVLDNSKRKQLLAPLRETVKTLLLNYWRASILDSVRLHHITSRLFVFLLSRNGQGLWSTFDPLGKSWETTFKQKSEVISMTEIVCCRRIVKLSQSALIAAYYYHHLHRPKTHKPPSTPLPSSHSLPSIGRRPPPPTRHRSHSHARMVEHAPLRTGTKFRKASVPRL